MDSQCTARSEVKKMLSSFNLTLSSLHDPPGLLGSNTGAANTRLRSSGGEGTRGWRNLTNQDLLCWNCFAFFRRNFLCFLKFCNLITLKTQFIFTICGRPFKKITFSPSNNFSYRVSQKRCTIECCWNYSAQVISPVTSTPCVRKNVLGPFFTKTKQDQALLSHVHGKIQPHSTQFLLCFFSIGTFFMAPCIPS